MKKKKSLIFHCNEDFMPELPYHTVVNSQK